MTSKGKRLDQGQKRLKRLQISQRTTFRKGCDRNISGAGVRLGGRLHQARAGKRKEGKIHVFWPESV